MICMLKQNVVSYCCDSFCYSAEIPCTVDEQLWPLYRALRECSKNVYYYYECFRLY